MVGVIDRCFCFYHWNQGRHHLGEWTEKFSIPSCCLRCIHGWKFFLNTIIYLRLVSGLNLPNFGSNVIKPSLDLYCVTYILLLKFKCLANVFLRFRSTANLNTNQLSGITSSFLLKLPCPHPVYFIAQMCTKSWVKYTTGIGASERPSQLFQVVIGRVQLALKLQRGRHGGPKYCFETGSYAKLRIYLNLPTWL